MPSFRLILALVTTLACVGAAHSQNSAPSSHFVFDDRFDGDIIINSVRVPKGGEAMNTYYEVLGWRGTGAGYCGIQVHPKGRNFIFSIWDHKSHTSPIKAVHHGPGTTTEGFGGEGTGLKSLNFKLGWKTDVWYTLVSRNWPMGEHTYYAFWAQAHDSRRWTHLVTMDVATPKAHFEGSTDAFIEDWSSTGAKPRTTHLRGGWKRRLDGSWHPFGLGRYSVNSWDLAKGKRSYNFRENWNGGTARDQTGEYYHMTAGGAKTKPTANNPSKHVITRSEKTPQFDKLTISQVKVSQVDGRTLSVAWKIDETTMPQFSYQIEIYDNRDGPAKPIVAKAANVPHVRKETLDVSDLNLKEKPYLLRLTCTDILDRKSETKIVAIGKGTTD